MKKISIIVLAAMFSAIHFPLSTCSAQDAVYKVLKHEWTVNADGTSDYHYRHEVQILRNRALVAYAGKGETFVVYNPDLEELTVNEVYTLQKDGTRVEMPQNAFVYQLPSECADCGRFNHLRELAMVHTGMELGCTIVVDYTIHRRFNLVYEYIPLMRECPVESLVVAVTYPEGYKPEFTFIGGTMKLDTRTNFLSTDEGNQTFGYVFSKVEQAPQEYYMPSDVIPMLHIYNGVPEFTPAFDRQGLAEAEEVAMKLLASDDTRENVCAIRDYVVDNIHLNDLPAAKLGYTHSSAAEVWRSGCGTATDKAVLLAALLNQVDYRARVMGEAGDEVGVMIDTLEYTLDVRSKTPLTLYGEAKDEVKTVVDKGSAEARLDTVGDGFYRLRLPEVPGSPRMRAANLSLVRTAPLQASACDLQSDRTYLLPKGVKLVGGAIDRKLEVEGVGRVAVSVKQSGKKLRVVRSLKLELSQVPVEHYGDYRRLLALWQETDNVLLRAQ